MIRTAFLWVLLVWPVFADPATDAERAANQLLEASEKLSSASTRSDRVAALTSTIRAYEGGLAALRTAVLNAQTREKVLQLQLDARDDQLARVLAVLSTLQTAPETFLLLHPSGPLATAQAGMVAADVAPALQAELADIKAILSELQTLKAVRIGAAETLTNSLKGVEDARTALTQAINDRTPLPSRFSEDDAAMVALVEAAETLDAFAANLEPSANGSATGFADAKGTLALPVAGRILRQAGEKDAAGVARPGWLIATEPRALVTAPRASTVRYSGPLLDYGNVIILEPESGYLLVFTGLGDVFVDRGAIVGSGTALGLMPGIATIAGDILTGISEGGGQEASETLYIEVREAKTPVDPAEWFQAGRQG